LFVAAGPVPMSTLWWPRHYGTWNCTVPLIDDPVPDGGDPEGRGGGRDGPSGRPWPPFAPIMMVLADLIIQGRPRPVS